MNRSLLALLIAAALPVRSTENKNQKKYRLPTSSFTRPPPSSYFQPIFFILSHILMGRRSFKVVALSKSGCASNCPIYLALRVRGQLRSRVHKGRRATRRRHSRNLGRAISAPLSPSCVSVAFNLYSGIFIERPLLPAEKLAPTLFVNNVSYSDGAAAASIRRAAFFAPSPLPTHVDVRGNHTSDFALRFRITHPAHAAAASPGIILPIHIMVICQRVIRRGPISPRINLPLPLNIQWAEYLFPQSYTESESQRRR